jgi:hypothetical protein
MSALWHLSSLWIESNISCPRSDDGDNFVGIGGPGEGLGSIVHVEKSLDRSLKIDANLKTARDGIEPFDTAPETLPNFHERPTFRNWQ